MTEWAHTHISITARRLAVRVCAGVSFFRGRSRKAQPHHARRAKPSCPMSRHRPLPQFVTVGLIKLAAPIHSQLHESGLQAMLSDLPGVSTVKFPREDEIEVKYDASLVGERSFEWAVRNIGYTTAEFDVRDR